MPTIERNLTGETLEIPTCTVAPARPAGGPGTLTQQQLTIQTDAAHSPVFTADRICNGRAPQALLRRGHYPLRISRQRTGTLEGQQGIQLP